MRRLIFLLTVLVAGSVRSQTFDCGLTPPDRSQQDQLVWQYTPFLSESEVAQLNAKLVSFARETSNQILVIVVDTLCGLPESDLAFDIGEKWGIGKKGFDNGIVLLIKPNGTPGQRKVYIATGYGLEGAIPDLMGKRIVENEVIPNFKAGNYYRGVASATDVLMAMAKGEFNEKSYGKGDQGPPWPFLVFILVVIAAFAFAWRNRVSSYSKTNNVDFWTAMFLLSQMDRKHSGRYTGGGSWGGGGGGFSGGGGFGGFGGGGFGGGGAGGSW